ncbi:FkbM family methyltransferase [Citrifermentans bremense]|uniref:Methyltransferase FkbM domain-containing protein n=1 Tax=Citrifermentans bremense TaxID=60035 RepID=A0A6S6M063_9BACT|nr:FkbM family methyltransferase [Citrifermentans bremense]
MDLDGVKLLLKQGLEFARGHRLPKAPELSCPTLTLGDPSYGAWTFCPQGLTPGGIVYSFGVGEDISWDLAIIEKYGVAVHAFDPTPRSAEFVKRQSLPGEFVFHPYGLADYDGTALFYPPENSEWVSHTLLRRRATAGKAIEVQVRRLETIMLLLGHDKINLLKMDIEGAEYGVIPDILNSSLVAGGAEQLLVEFHHRFPGKGVKDTIFCIEALEKAGLRSFHISQNGEDWGFAREDGKVAP